MCNSRNIYPYDFITDHENYDDELSDNDNHNNVNNSDINDRIILDDINWYNKSLLMLDNILDNKLSCRIIVNQSDFNFIQEFNTNIKNKIDNTYIINYSKNDILQELNLCSTNNITINIVILFLTNNNQLNDFESIIFYLKDIVNINLVLLISSNFDFNNPSFKNNLLKFFNPIFIRFSEELDDNLEFTYRNNSLNNTEKWNEMWNLRLNPILSINHTSIDINSFLNKLNNEGDDILSISPNNHIFFNFIHHICNLGLIDIRTIEEFWYIINYIPNFNTIPNINLNLPTIFNILKFKYDLILSFISILLVSHEYIDNSKGSISYEDLLDVLNDNIHNYHGINNYIIETTFELSIQSIFRYLSKLNINEIKSIHEKLTSNIQNLHFTFYINNTYNFDL